MAMIKIPQSATEKFAKHYPQIIESGSLAEGEWNKKLSAFFREYTHAAYAAPFSSNGSGLLAILMLLKSYRKYEHVFIQDNTMYGVKTIAITSGLNYLSEVDCSLPNLMPTFSQVEAYINNLQSPEKTVFLLTHIGGIVNPDIAQIAELCKAKGVALVEDCAHSLGATINGKHTGLFGVGGVYSLYATKAVAAGEGGIVVSNDLELGTMLDKFLIYDRFDRKQTIGVNFRVSELQALFSYCVCELSEMIIENKSKIAEAYINVCKAKGISYVDPYQNGQRGNHYKFSLVAKNDVNEEFAGITQRTSPVYDYIIGRDINNIRSKHICLPIWYDLDAEIIAKTVQELQAL